MPLVVIVKAVVKLNAPPLMSSVISHDGSDEMAVPGNETPPAALLFIFQYPDHLKLRLRASPSSSLGDRSHTHHH